MSQFKRIIILVSLLFGPALLLVSNAGVSFESKINAKDLGGEERYLLYVSTDKPVYRENESLYLRAVVLNAADNTPLTTGEASVQVKIRGPKGDFVFQGFANGDDSSTGFKWSIPGGTPGGRYTALVTSPQLGIPQTERDFEIRAYRAPRLNTQIEFLREGYGPGDLVRASVEVERAEGGIPEDARVTVLARVDGEEIYRGSDYRVSADGMVETQFELPHSISVGDGSIAFIVEDGGLVETASKTIPIVLQTLDIAFYPEGGDLVAGLTSRVYIEARRRNGKPADIQGRIVAMEGDIPGNRVISKLKTEHEGRGLFSMKPEPGQSYALQIESPSGIDRHFLLPEIKTSGAVLRSNQSVFQYDEKIGLKIESQKLNPASKVTLHKRERLLDSQTINQRRETASLDAKDSEGVLMVTLWDSSGRPLAERLIYRAPKFAINVNISTDAESYVPGDEVSLDILTTDENGKPVEAVVGLSVTDDSILELIEKREQAPRLPVMVYLENEVRDLADAQVYLDNQNPQAEQAVDLLLGTQGWRRFILLNYAQIKQQYPDAAGRILAERAPEMAFFDVRNFQGQKFRKQMLMAAPAEVFEDEAVVDIAEPEPVIENNDIVQGFEQKALAVPPQAGLFDINAKPEADMMMEREIMPQPTFSIREYAYQVRTARKPNDRVDFSETLYWHKGIRTSARDGTASVKFGLSDSVTSFRILADSFGRNGALGSSDHIIQSLEPFYIEAKMPLQASVGDIIELPVTLVNASAQEMTSVNLLVRSEGLSINQVKPFDLAAGQRIRRILRITPDRPGDYSLNFSADSGAYVDSLTRKLSVKAKGFPINIHHGGLIGPQQNFDTRIVIPDDIEAGSISAIAKLYPSPLANMEEALNALLRQPNGCFEQTSSSNYPLVMAQQYFTSHQGVSPQKIAEAKKLLATGYQKLIGFESADNGYEWFGANPAHEALTAYGLMQFVDMAKLMTVDEQMIQRTRDWLLSRRDGEGGFQRNERALDSFGSAPVPTTNAYIVWALLESGENPDLLRQEIAAIKQLALNSSDQYIVALAANILYLANDRKSATALSAKLAAAVNQDGAIADGVTSITRSGGDALAIETTSLALLAWLKDDASWADRVETSMKWLFERSKSGRFGSTQSTILALKAINAYDAARAKPKKPGSVQLLVNQKPFGKPVTFDKTSKGAIELPDFASTLKPGKHPVALVMSDGSQMPFALEVSFNTSLPASSDTNGLKLKTSISSTEITEGELLEIQAVVHTGNEIAATPIAIIGIPSGLEVRHDQLQELIDADRISAYEVIGQELILYWRALPANHQRNIPVSLSAAIAGTYTAPASRAYLYYSDEFKHWEKGLTVTIAARH